MEPRSGTRRKLKPRCIVNYLTSRCTGRALTIKLHILKERLGVAGSRCESKMPRMGDTWETPLAIEKFGLWLLQTGYAAYALAVFWW